MGGTNLRGAVLTAEGEITARFRQKSEIVKGAVSFIERLSAELVALIGAVTAAGGEVGGVALGIPGLIAADGMIHSSVNLQPLVGVNLAGLIGERIGLPVISGNDANLIAVGEACFGAGRGLGSLMVITIGTGIGSGLILNGQLWSGADGFASEFGHVIVKPEGRVCRCGNRGCLEQYASAGALVRYGKGRLPEELARLADSGDLAALAAFDRLGYWLGIPLAGLVNTLNLEGIIIGGGVAASFRHFEDKLCQTIKGGTFPQISQHLKIRQLELGDDAGLLGGLKLLLSQGVKSNQTSGLLS